MSSANVNGITLDYEERGRSSDPPVLLITGLGAQRVTWPDELLDGLVDAGLRVITFDNRDVGESTILDHLPGSGSDIAAAVGGRRFTAPYSLQDMAADAAGLLDNLGIAAAHLVGVSMGGMIAQHLAFDWPDRVLSLTSIMSTTGERSVGNSTDEATAVLFGQPPSERGAYIDDAVRRRRILSNPTLYDEERARIVAGMVFDRGLHPAGTARQLLAIYADGDRTQRLARVTAPTLVIHGRQDPLIALSGGEATAAAIPGAELLVLDEMGHDLPAPLLPQVVTAIAAHIATAQDDAEQVA